MDLAVLWFILITILFIGFFFLEGFDYGVGMLLPFIGKNDTERRILINTIGPVWDGNEVWMITAGGALFAAFPHVYATMFSGFYMPLFLLLLALIGRGVAFEFRSKDESRLWRSTWDWAIFCGSAIPAFLWGVVVTNLIQGIKINEQMIYTGTFMDLLTPYTLLGGGLFVLVFLFHGAMFLTLKTEAYLILRARNAAVKAGAAAILAYIGCVVLTYANTDLFNSVPAVIFLLLTGVFFLTAYACAWLKKYAFGFIFNSAAIVSITVAVFTGLFPRLMVSSLQPEWSLTIYNAASTSYTLSIMTAAAFCFVPVVLIYQGWTYWIFRKRVSGKHLEY